MSEGRVTYSTQGALARLVLDQPARMNAMSFDMWSSLPGLVAQAEADASIRALVLEGAGDKAFCAGADISQFGDKRTGAEATRAYDAAVAAGMAALVDCSKPVIGLIRGICFGGGLMLALCCDIRLVRADARFRLPAARLGLGYGANNIALMLRRLGETATADILLSARIVGAEDALRLRVATSVASVESFEEESAAALARIGSNAPLTLAAIKRGLVELAKPEGARDLAAVTALVERCFASADYREGQAAFREKREPNFTGR